MSLRNLTMRQLDEDWYSGGAMEREAIIEELDRRNENARAAECMAEDAGKYLVRAMLAQPDGLNAIVARNLGIIDQKGRKSWAQSY